MKIRVFGFEWTMGSGITPNEFAGHLIGLGEQRVKHGPHERMLLVARKPPHCVGLLVTIKDQRRFCELMEDGESFVVKVRDIATGSNLMDFNFFVLHEKTGRGLYQYYHHSCSLNQFCLLCRGQYDELRESRISADVEASGGVSCPESKRKKIDRHYAKKMTWAQMVRSENLKALLAEFEDIRAFDFNMMTVYGEEPLFTPLTKYARRMNHRIGFQSSRSLPAKAIGTIRRGILSVVNQKHLQEGRVSGKDADGLDKVIRLVNEPDCFEEYDLDDVVANMGFDIRQFASSAFLGEMLRIAKKHEALLASAAR